MPDPDLDDLTQRALVIIQYVRSASHTKSDGEMIPFVRARLGEANSAGQTKPVMPNHDLDALAKRIIDTVAEMQRGGVSELDAFEWVRAWLDEVAKGHSDVCG